MAETPVQRPSWPPATEPNPTLYQLVDMWEASAKEWHEYALLLEVEREARERLIQKIGSAIHEVRLLLEGELRRVNAFLADHPIEPVPAPTPPPPFPSITMIEDMTKSEVCALASRWWSYANALEWARTAPAPAPAAPKRGMDSGWPLIEPAAPAPPKEAGK